MIITRSPLRITLGGGGTDLPSYYLQHEGFLIAAAIDRYIYITIHQTFIDELIVKYSKLEKVMTLDELEHPIVREALKLVGQSPTGLEITSMADIPAGTGLGSSGSFTTALLKALHALKRNLIHPRELAEQACHIEIDLLKEPIGKQDQYIAAYGGVTCFHFRKDGSVDAAPLKIDRDQAQSGRQPGDVLHRLFAQGRLDPERAGRQDQEGRQRHGAEPALREGPGLSQPGRAGKRRPGRLRQADGRALAA